MTHRPSYDPDSPEYANDDSTWGDDFHQHAVKAQRRVEEILDGGKYCSECRAVTNHRAEAHDEETRDD